MKSLVLGALLVLALGCLFSDTVDREVTKFGKAVVRKIHKWEAEP